MNRYLESICTKTGKNIGYLWQKECYEPIPLPKATEESTSDDNKLTQNANNMAENTHTKVCKDCGKELPIEMFQRQARSKDGYMHICKDCKQKRMTEAYKKMEEKPKAEPTEFEEHLEMLDALMKISDQELVDELRQRGWDVKCTKTISL